VLSVVARTAKKQSPIRSATSRQRSAGRRDRNSSTDAIAFLKADHREVETLFAAYEKAGERALRTKRKLVDDMVRALSQHAAIEEQFFYPAVRRQVPSANRDVLEALEEHHVVKWLLSELADMDAADERFNAKVAVLTESVRHHVREEEHDLFPEVRAAMGRKDLVELREKLEEAKRLAPTRPHPRSPDEPPGNVIVGTVAGVVDRARSAVKTR
jgi:hemerythrin superfamily protein